MGPTNRCSLALALLFAFGSAMQAQAQDMSKFTLKDLQRLMGKTAGARIARVNAPGCWLYAGRSGTGKKWRYSVDTRYEHQGAVPLTGKANLSSSADDNVSSVRCDWEPGKQRCVGILYTDRNQQGNGLMVRGSDGLVNLTPPMNNQISSVMLYCGA